MKNAETPSPHADGKLSQRAYLLMLSSSFSFAVMGILSHIAGERVSWQVVLAARTLVAFVLCFGLSLLSGVRLISFKPALLWMRSLTGTCGILCLFYALTHLPVSTALTLANTTPVWVTLLVWPILRQRPTPGVWTAVVLSIIGIVLIERPQTGGAKLAALSALAYAVCTALSMIGLNKLRGIEPRAIVMHFSAVSSLITLVVLILTGGVEDHDVFQSTGVVLLVGVGIAGLIGQLTMTRAFALGNPAKVSIVGLAQVVFALLFDLLLKPRPFRILELVGIVLVLAPSGWLILHNALDKETSTFAA